MKNILVVDDSDAMRQSIHYILHIHGYRVVEALSGDEGFRYLRSGHFDLVIADDHKPFFDSEDFARHVKEENSGLPVLSVCGHRRALSERDQNMESCLDGSIMRPFSTATLLHEIRRLCG